jgi:hypothetical protein
MHRRLGLTALGAAAVLALSACGASGEEALPRLARGEPVTTAPFEPPARLCEAIPGSVVAEATGRSPVTVEGAGTQCTWRSPDADGDEAVLQGSFIDVASFVVGRPGGTGATDVPDLGDDAYLVREGELSPPTLYVRDGSVAFALWLADPTASEPEGALAHLAREVLSS